MRRYLSLCVAGLVLLGPAVWAQQTDPLSRSNPQSPDPSRLDDATTDEDQDETDDSVFDTAYDRENPHILEAVEPVASRAELATVSILSSPNARRNIALGTIVDSTGLVITKASELSGDLYCKLSDGRVLSAVVFGIHTPTDLAMLKIDAVGLPTAPWSPSEPPPVGYWLITPRPSKSPNLGVVSVQPRVIRPPAGVMGVYLAKADNGVRITRVNSNSPAEKAGVQINDVIIAVDGKPETQMVELQMTIQQHVAGDVVEVTAIRDGKEIKFTIKLADRTDSGTERADAQNQMGGRLSKRRMGFPMAIQHDTTLTPNECGGPVVDLTGNVVGINIARSGRVDSLALPAATVLSVLDVLKSGQLAPAVIHKSEIESINKRLEEIAKEMEVAPASADKLDTELGQQTSREDELQKIVNDLQSRLDEVKTRRSTLEKELGLTKTKIRDLENEKERLERDLQRLQTGTN